MTAQNWIDLIILILCIAAIAIVVFAFIIIVVINHLIRNSDLDDCEYSPEEKRFVKK